MRKARILFRYLMVFIAVVTGTVSVALELKGVVVQGAMLIGRVAPGTQVELIELAGITGIEPATKPREIRVEKDGLFVFGLGRNARSKIALLTSNGTGEKESHVFDVEQREYREQRVEGVPQRTVTPPKEVLERIRREARLVRQARSDDSHMTDFLAGFAKPLEGPITGVYGSRRVYNGTPGRPHYGLDIAAPTGTDVFAPAPGVVKLTHRDMFYSGGTLIIDHGQGVSSTFIHLSDVLVTEGQRVEAGDLIARVGATGRATGPHLDWRINWFDVRLDPEVILKSFPPIESSATD